MNAIGRGQRVGYLAHERNGRPVPSYIRTGAITSMFKDGSVVRIRDDETKKVRMVGRSDVMAGVVELIDEIKAERR